MAKTLTSFLAERPEDELQVMLDGVRERRERLKAEERDLAVEQRLIEQALGRQARRSGSSGHGRVSKEQVFEIVSAAVSQRFKPADAQEALQAAGHTMGLENLRQHLRRLAAEGSFPREGDWYLNPRAPEQPPAANGSGPTTQAFPNPNVEGVGRDRELGTSQDSPF